MIDDGGDGLMEDDQEEQAKGEEKVEDHEWEHEEMEDKEERRSKIG